MTRFETRLLITDNLSLDSISGTSKGYTGTLQVEQYSFEEAKKMVEVFHKDSKPVLTFFDNHEADWYGTLSHGYGWPVPRSQGKIIDEITPHDIVIVCGWQKGAGITFYEVKVSRNARRGAK